MKLSVVVALTLCLALAFAPAVSAQRGISPDLPKKQPAQQGKAAQAGQPVKDSWVVSGTVAQVNPNQNQIVIATEKGRLPVVMTNQTRAVTTGDKAIFMSNFQQGDPVLAAFHQEGNRNVATFLYKPEGAGRGGQPQAGGRNIGPQQLGPAQTVAEGRVAERQDNKLILSVPGGRQDLVVTNKSAIYGADLGKTSVGNVAQGQRVLVSWRPTDGQKEVWYLYMLQ